MIIYGYFAYVFNEDCGYEPEGTIYFNKQPEKGDVFKGAFGILYTVTNVHVDEMTLRAVPCEDSTKTPINVNYLSPK